MKAIKQFWIVCVLFVSLCDEGFCVVYKGINPEQPISVGQIIYCDGEQESANGLEWVESVQYTYLGMEDNTLKFKVETENTFAFDDKETSALNLPLNDKKQTLLKVSPMQKTKEDYLKKPELLIKVVDEFGSIAVEEYKK